MPPLRLIYRSEVLTKSEGKSAAEIKKSFKCRECDLWFTTNAARNIHLKIHTTDQVLKCSLCRYVTRCHSELRKHRMNDRHLKTRICLKRDLTMYTITSSGDKLLYQCNQCVQAFSLENNLDIHIRTHTGEKPYHCEHCDKAFSREKYLGKHIRTHTGEKPYQCSHCDKAFLQKQHLKIHIRTHTGEKPYQCSQCDKAFSLKSSLDNHTRTHTGYKLYECSQCSKAFSWKQSLVNHIRTHTGETPYQCRQCDKAFSRNDSFDEHIRTHTWGKPYQCSQCDKNFSQKSNLRTHIKKKQCKTSLSSNNAHSGNLREQDACSGNQSIRSLIKEELYDVEVKEEDI